MNILLEVGKRQTDKQIDRQTDRRRVKYSLLGGGNYRYIVWNLLLRSKHLLTARCSL